MGAQSPDVLINAFREIAALKAQEREGPPDPRQARAAAKVGRV